MEVKGIVKLNGNVEISSYEPDAGGVAALARADRKLKPAPSSEENHIY